MMNSINLMGRLTKDPEKTTVPSGAEKANFCLACERDTKAQNATEYGTDFINCIAWGKRAEFVYKYFQKGQLCGVTGRLEINQYTDADGAKKSFTQVNVNSIYFCERKGNGKGANAQAQQAPEYTADAFAMLDGDDSDLPF